MRKIKKICFIILFITFSITFLFCIPVPVPTGSTPVTNSPKDNTWLEKNKFIKEKLLDTIINKDRNKKFNNSNSIILIEKSNLKDFFIKLEDLQISTNNVKKNIKILNNNENYQIKNEYINIQNSLIKLEIVNVNFLSKIDQENRQLVKDQNENIKNSITNLQNLFVNINKNLDKIKSNDELYNKTIEIEKKIKNINRQYRAIEWILIEQ